nr:LysR family transcriptional regulator [Thermosporothrix sp. COM3]
MTCINSLGYGMDLLQLRYFQTVARLEHITKAARELSIAQPSLSQTIARLEEELGVPLFDREGRRIRLNRFGRAFLHHIDRALKEIEAGKAEVADLAGLERGQVTLAFTLTQLVPDLLSAFLAQYPQVHFRLFQQHSPQQALYQLENGEIDLCISSPPIMHPGIESAPLFTEEIFLVVPRTHRLATEESVRLQDFAHDPFIGLKSGDSWRELTDSFCHRAGFEPVVAFEGDEWGTIRGLVKAGLGVAFLPASSWTGLYEPDVALMRIEEPLCMRRVGLAWREERYLSLAARSFRYFVIEYFSQLERSGLFSAVS